MPKPTLELVTEAYVAHKRSETDAVQYLTPSLPPIERQPDDRIVAPILRGGEGGGTTGGVSDDWKVSVDQRLSTLHDDTRNLLKGGFAAAFTFVAAIGGLYFFIGQKNDASDARVDNLAQQVAVAGQKVDDVDGNVHDLKGLLGRIEDKLDRLAVRR